MQQALDALEGIQWPGSPSFVKAAITALFERLAQPEQKPMHPTLQKMWEGYFDKCYKREWVGLTEEEEERLIHNFGSDPHTLLDEVNARLKKRNT